jgi:hypothetical protein
MANLFVIFPGFHPGIVDRMSLGELMRWHDKAIARHEAKG